MRDVIAVLALIVTLVLAHKALLAWQMGAAARVDAVALTAGTLVGVLLLVEHIRSILTEDRRGDPAASGRGDDP